MDILNGIKYWDEVNSNVNVRSSLDYHHRLDFCVVCGDKASGRHYGAISCEGCKGFFKRSIRKQLGYSCRGNQDCEVDKQFRNRCQFCRLQKCLQMGMTSDSVQLERRPFAKTKDNSFGASFSGSPASVFAQSDASYSRKSFTAFDSNNSFQDDNDAQSPGENENSDRATTLAKTIDDITAVMNESAQAEDQCTLFADLDVDNLIPEECLSFVFVSPCPKADNGLINIKYVSESASRLLFLTVHWTKLVPAFLALSSNMQLTMIKSAWSELFAIGLVQCHNELSLTSALSALIIQLQSSCTTKRLSTIADIAAKLQAFIKIAQGLHLDDFEFAALRALTMFTGDRLSVHGVGVTVAVQEIQSRHCKYLQEYTKLTTGDPENDTRRLQEILLLLPLLKSFTSTGIGDLFFANMLDSPIDNVIPYVFNLNLETDLPISATSEAEEL